MRQRLVPAAMLVWLAAAAFYGYCLVREEVVAPKFEGDTGVLLRGVLAAKACLDRGQYRACPGVESYPLLQYLPSLALVASGQPPQAAFRLFSVLSTLAFAGIVLLLAVTLRGRGGGAALAGLLWLGSFSVWYFTTTFGEVVAGFLTLAFVVSCVWRRSAVVTGLLMGIAGITKEFAPAFLLALGLLALLASARPPLLGFFRREWRMLAALGVAAAGSVALNAGFNVFRFGVVTNTYNLQPINFALDFRQEAISFAGLWVSPNGGLLLFAPALTVLVGVGAVGAVLDVRAGRTRWWESAAAPGVLAVLVALTAGLSKWYSPFGWWCWGPRLVLPWLPAAIFLLLRFRTPALDRALSFTLQSTRRAALVAAAVAALALPHAVFTYTPDLYHRFFVANPECDMSANIHVDHPGFFKTLNCLMFPREEFLLPKVYRLASRESSRWPAIAYLVLIGGLCFLTRRSRMAAPAGSPAERPPPESTSPKASPGT